MPKANKVLPYIYLSNSGIHGTLIDAKKYKIYTRGRPKNCGNEKNILIFMRWITPLHIYKTRI